MALPDCSLGLLFWIALQVCSLGLLSLVALPDRCLGLLSWVTHRVALLDGSPRLLCQVPERLSLDRSPGWLSFVASWMLFWGALPDCSLGLLS